MTLICVIHENDAWVEPLRAAFQGLGLPHEEWHLDQGSLDLASSPPEGVFLIASYVVARQRPDPEKVSAYECGFDAFDDARGRFDVRFYLVAILFIIFDLEIAVPFPWAIALGDIGVFGYWSMMVFLGVLTIGFVYEWKKGALEWK